MPGQPAAQTTSHAVPALPRSLPLPAQDATRELALRPPSPPAAAKEVAALKAKLRTARAEAQHYKSNLEVRWPLLGCGLRAYGVVKSHCLVSSALLGYANRH